MNARHVFLGGFLLVTVLLVWNALPGSAAATYTVVNNHDSGSGSLRQAIANAGANSTIIFNLTYPTAITLTSGQLTIDKNLTIAGPGASKLIVSGGNVTRTFHIQSGASVTISGLALTNGYADDGGIVYNEGELTLTGCLSSGSHVLDNGGGAYSEGQLTVSGCTFSGNRADNDGGGIFNFGGTLTVTDSTFSGNTASDNSGGLGNMFGSATVTSCVFSSNDAGNDGGGIGNDWTLSVANSTFSNNTAADNGGGINSFGPLIVDQGIFLSNNAVNDGGGVASYDTLTMTACTLSGNSSGDRGGGIANLGLGLLSLTNSTFSGNHTDGDGGGIGNQGDADVVNSTFDGNSAGDGGGMSNAWGELALINSTFVGNSADVDGGGIYATFGATATVQNTIVGNSTSGGNCSGLLTEGSSQNLATDETCSPGFTQVTPAQLALGALTGSPAYFPLNPDSVAIDAGTNTGCPATDQRGVSRPQDGDGNGTVICDVGSYEALWLPHKVYLPLIKKS